MFCIFQRAVVDREWIKEKQAAVKDFEVSLSGSFFFPTPILLQIHQAEKLSHLIMKSVTLRYQAISLVCPL